MPDMSAIGAALASFNTLKNIVQTMIGLHDIHTFQAKVIEFNAALIDAQTKILSVNEERTALIERVRKHEEDIANLKTWEAEKQRYEAKTTAGGGFAYFLKPEAQGSETSHKICANCYVNNKKRILQPKPRSIVNAHLGTPPMLYCPECESEIPA